MSNQLCIYDKNNAPISVKVGDVVYISKKDGCHQLFQFFDGDKWVGHLRVSSAFRDLHKDTVEVEYGVDSKYQKRGIATAMVEFIQNRLFVEEAFDKPLSKVFEEKTECNKIVLRINTANARSKRVAEKTGFKFKEVQGYCMATLTKSNYLENKNNSIAPQPK